MDGVCLFNDLCLFGLLRSLGESIMGISTPLGEITSSPAPLPNNAKHLQGLYMKGCCVKWKSAFLTLKSGWISGMYSNIFCSFLRFAAYTQPYPKISTLTTEKQFSPHATLCSGKVLETISQFYLVPITVVTKQCTPLSTEYKISAVLHC